MAASSNRAQTGVTWTLQCLVLLSGLVRCRPDVRRYHFVDQPMTWPQARDYCSAGNATLASMDDGADVGRLLAAARRGFEGGAWFGLYDGFWSWRWSLTDQRLHQNGTKSFKAWGDGEPNDPRTHSELCAAVWRERLRDVSCRAALPFLCYTDENITGVSNISSERFFYVEEPKTWHEARAVCRQNHTDLAAARDAAELAAVARAVPPDVLAAVGARRDVWSWWSDRAWRPFRNWLPGRPTPRGGNCASCLVGGDTPGKWVERHCGEKLPFFCMTVEKQKRQWLRIRLTGVKSSADLNDPAVTDGLLRLISEKLKENGIQTSFKMSWKKRKRSEIFLKEETNPRPVDPCL